MVLKAKNKNKTKKAYKRKCYGSFFTATITIMNHIKTLPTFLIHLFIHPCFNMFLSHMCFESDLWKLTSIFLKQNKGVITWNFKLMTKQQLHQQKIWLNNTEDMQFVGIFNQKKSFKIKLKWLTKLVWKSMWNYEMWQKAEMKEHLNDQF